jgi:DNA-binding CsgD family transcriptional regulator
VHSTGLDCPRILSLVAGVLSRGPGHNVSRGITPWGDDRAAHTSATYRCARVIQSVGWKVRGVRLVATDDVVNAEGSLRDAVVASPLSVALVDPAAQRFLALSASAQEQLGLVDVELSTLDVVQLAGEPQVALEVARLVRDGVLQHWRWQRWMTTPGGRRVDYVSTGRTLTVERSRHLGLVFYAPAAVGSDGVHDDTGHDGNAGASAPGARALLAGELFDLVHPDDAQPLGEALARAVVEGGPMSTVVRVRKPGRAWQHMRVDLRPEDDGDEDVGRAWPEPHPAALDRIAELERRMWVIAREVLAAGVTVESRGVEAPHLEDLTSRQLEIVSRLVQGERVPTIARSMFLSQKTVRTHLANVFRKFDVHSQAELLDVIRRER